MVMDSVVYRQRAGRTILSAKPRKPRVPPSEKQLQHRERFRAASRYAKAAARQEVIGALYATQADGFNSAYNIALKDYLSAPVIDGFDTKGFRGRKGEYLGVYAEDNFGVATLTVSIMNEAGEVLASGIAEEAVYNTYFTYRLSGGLPVSESLVLRAEAKDYAGNVTAYEEVMQVVPSGKGMQGMFTKPKVVLLTVALFLMVWGSIERVALPGSVLPVNTANTAWVIISEMPAPVFRDPHCRQVKSRSHTGKKHLWLMGAATTPTKNRVVPFFVLPPGSSRGIW